jgi:hypothetical protein
MYRGYRARRPKLRELVIRESISWRERTAVLDYSTSLPPCAWSPKFHQQDSLQQRKDAETKHHNHDNGGEQREKQQKQKSQLHL